MRLSILPLLPLCALGACAGPVGDDPDDTDDTDPVDTDGGADTDTLIDTDSPADTDTPADTDAPATDTDEASPFAVEVVSFTPGAFAGFGADAMPAVVLGAPLGRGPSAGSLDVVSLGQGGAIVLRLGAAVVDGPGVDLLVFENPFPNWIETGEVSVSDDGTTWHTWTCHADDADGGWPGCAGVVPVLSHPDNGIDPTDPAVAGGDGFDLADLGLARATYVRIVDSAANDLGGLGYAGTTGGFDLDAVAVVHAAP